MKPANDAVQQQQQTDQVATATEEQSVVANEISCNAANIAGIARNTAEISEQSSTDNHSLAQQAEELQERVSAFKL